MCFKIPVLLPKFPTVALQRSKSSASVHGGSRIETPGTCAFNIHSIYLTIMLFSLMCLSFPVKKAYKSYPPLCWRQALASLRPWVEEHPKQCQKRLASRTLVSVMFELG